MTQELSAWMEREKVSRVDFCRRIGAHAPDLSRWLSGDRPIPPHMCPVIERETGGAAVAERLSDKVRWVRIFDPAWPHPDGRPCIDVASAVTAEHPAPQREAA